MAIPPLIGNPYNGYINPYYWVDDHPLLYGNNGSLDPSTYRTGSLLKGTCFVTKFGQVDTRIFIGVSMENMLVHMEPIEILNHPQMVNS